MTRPHRTMFPVGEEAEAFVVVGTPPLTWRDWAAIARDIETETGIDARAVWRDRQAKACGLSDDWPEQPWVGDTFYAALYTRTSFIDGWHSCHAWERYDDPCSAPGCLHDVPDRLRPDPHWLAQHAAMMGDLWPTQWVFGAGDEWCASARHIGWLVEL